MLNRRLPGAVGTRAARTFVSASTQYLTASTGFGLGANDPFYVAIWVRRDSTSTQLFTQLGVSATNANSRSLYCSATNTVGAFSEVTGGISSSALSGTSFTSGSGWRAVIGEWAATNSRRLILDGTATSNTTTRSMAAAPDTFRVGASLIAGVPASAGIAHVAIFAGTASDALIAAHARGVHPTQLPGQLLECWDLDRVGPIIGLVRGTVLSPVNGGSLTVGPHLQGPPRFYELPLGYLPGGTAYSLTCDPGTYALTGASADTRFGRVLAADSGSYSLTGTDAATLVGRVLLTEAGAYALTGSDAATLAGRVLSAAAGDYAITGTDAAFLRGYVLDLAPGSYDLTGAAATLLTTGAAELTADPGVYAIDGAAATLLVHRVLACDPGTYSVTGVAVELRTGRVLTADPGAYALTGSAATTNYSGLTIPDVIRIGAITRAERLNVGTLTRAERLNVGSITNAEDA